MNFRAARITLLMTLGVSLVSSLGCHRHKHAPPDLSASQEPDKVLYEQAVEDIKNKRYDVARMLLQAMLNTYPDSDYLAKAKLAVADSYYEEGTTSSLAHAEIEYKDFITFFPNEPETARAQYRAAMVHFKQLELPDRDNTHAFRAQQEFQLLLKNYPDSEFAEDGERKLIQVQEVLAEGQFRVGRFYHIQEGCLAAASRMAELVERYPNYSKRDEALWLLGELYSMGLVPGWIGDDKLAALAYSRLLQEHPLSEYAGDAKKELARLEHPIPEPDPEALQRAQTVKPVVEEVGEKPGLLSRMFGRVSGRVDTSQAAARLGPPPLDYLPDIPIPLAPSQRDVTQRLQELAANQQGKEGGPNGGVQVAKKSFWRKLIPFY